MKRGVWTGDEINRQLYSKKNECWERSADSDLSPTDSDHQVTKTNNWDRRGSWRSATGAASPWCRDGASSADLAQAGGAQHAGSRGALRALLGMAGGAAAFGHVLRVIRAEVEGTRTTLHRSVLL